jgi:two-component system phosphate regulon sensor histidine kinase PhoR
MGEGVLVLDREGRIVLANRALRDMTLIAADARGKSVIEAMRNAALQQVLDEAATVDEAVVREVEIGGLKPRRVLVRASQMQDEGVAAVFLDVTDLRRLETIRTDFVANVSHELRTPVTAISTAVETLLAGALDDPKEAIEFAAVIERQAKRLRQLVDDLLDLSKIEARTYKLALAEAEVGPIVEQAVRMLRDSAEARRVEIVFKDAPRAARARIDRRAVEQVVSNLLENAIKYAGEGAHVRVSLEPRGERLLIAVADDGPGIAATHLGRLFERFYRVDAGRSRDLGGTGLGLSIVKHLVELMSGRIEVESVVGKGTTFTVDLPLLASDLIGRPGRRDSSNIRES